MFRQTYLGLAASAAAALTALDLAPLMKRNMRLQKGRKTLPRNRR